MHDDRPILELSGLRKSLGGTPVVGDVTVRLERGEFLVIVGPSGCGKTTLLRLIAGLVKPDEGVVSHLGKPVGGPPPGMAVVFQDYTRSLFPWLSVRKNVGFGLKGIDAAERDRRVDEALSAVGLDGFGDRYPWQLSGGMQQRTALARAIAAQPQVLLLDEPFAAVDAQTRMDLQTLLAKVCQEFSISALFVTHDIEEAVLLGDRVVTLSNRPTRVSAVLTVDLPRPRDQITTKSLPEFARLREDIYGRIRSAKREQKGVPAGVNA